MKTDLLNEPTKAGFLQTVGIALGKLKQQLQRDYERAYPELSEVIHLILDEEESRAWSLTLFPHLLLPDLVEAHVAKLNLGPVERKDAEVFATHRHHRFGEDESAYALCA
jgi:hypothetical protein